VSWRQQLQLAHPLDEQVPAGKLPAGQTQSTCWQNRTENSSFPGWVGVWEKAKLTTGTGGREWYQLIGLAFAYHSAEFLHLLKGPWLFKLHKTLFSGYRYTAFHVA
jgi:hypothetical protein